MLKIIKKSMVSFLILALIFTVGCSKDKKENTNTETSTSASETHAKDNSNVEGIEGNATAGTTDSSFTESDYSDSDFIESILEDKYEALYSERYSNFQSYDQAPSNETPPYVSTESNPSSPSSDIDASSLPPSDINTKSQTKTPKEAVTKILDNIKAGKFDEAKDIMITDETATQSLGFDAYAMKRIKKIFKKLDYKIISAKYMTDYEASVTVKISALDFEAIFSPYMKKSIKLSRSGKAYTEKQLNKKLDIAFNTYFKNKAKVVNTKVNLHLFKTEEGWKLRDSLNFARACLGGADSVESVIQEAGESIDKAK